MVSMFNHGYKAERFRSVQIQVEVQAQLLCVISFVTMSVKMLDIAQEGKVSLLVD